ncbi:MULTISPECIES: NAD(P)-dependent alcohol dehydrogenase [unclassified Rhizobium]|uniref:NAD(P)-dependent alcohol dehydrogenase n=1 Tax=unclassified Rhizobium TaxID=2613769 RepID=UPI001AD9F4E0|nr:MULTISPECIES: NAD(P)-dependent alcohol dehydrogenase [unclassified Rhizobium]MBO9099882.1 NAD(P)-dependent alcohol dehydrogenase [Rhizobium sp. L58/93]MBO9131575.1 NAD(P)-dependent alcohol dehydrogenase [Rhizobium sp. B209b/85]MBO9169871.1 NAD(P)-dependent alcohol dehydrogenase [Rhizobium sp. L245/93]MBO9185829.1 NAD(P)-dependent alcohol dehydrogenase [Rhizobium sp. E27B/91]QXZ82592.1 NAD(P)-dependent alcohol dehydrogenase [Rhizobium sp. K1/93]
MTKMRALVLERQHELALRDIDLPQEVGAGQVKIKIHTVGVCGSDVHYYTHGRIGGFIVNAPMVLGHEAAGTVVEIGAGVTHLKIGDRVCMEPGIPDANSRASRLGMYNVDPAVVFWATPPVHGVLTPYVVHPANYTFKLPDNVSFAEGAMVEPFAVGMQAASKARIAPGDTAVVLGAGPIGTMVAIAALAGGCSRVIVADLAQPKLDIAAQYQGIIPVNIRETKLLDELNRLTDGWGADVVFECSGSPKAWETIMELPRPGGAIVAVGLPVAPVAIDVSIATTKEVRIETVFRYAHQYDRAIALIGSGRVDLKPLISETFGFEQSIQAFERAAEGRPSDVKLQIVMDQ